MRKNHISLLKAHKQNIRETEAGRTNWIAGLFIPPIRESIELLYQYDSDYLFDSSKFNKAFNFTPTTYAEGIAATVRWYKEKAG